MAALLSGDLDFVLDPPVQDIDKLKQDKNIKVYEGRENRIIFFGFDQVRDELLYSNVKGKNPFKDKRVRQAFYQAIDVNAIKKAVMRGLSVPTAINLPNPRARGIPKSMDKRYPVRRRGGEEAAGRGGLPERLRGPARLPEQPLHQRREDLRRHWRDAGEDRHHREGERDPARPVLPEGAEAWMSACTCWAGAAPRRDAIFTLQPVLHSRNDKGDGDYNWGNYKDPEFDALIDDAKGDTDAKRRQQTIIKAMQMHHDNVYLIPLHLQVIPWASRSNVEVVTAPTTGCRPPGSRSNEAALRGSRRHAREERHVTGDAGLHVEAPPPPRVRAAVLARARPRRPEARARGALRSSTSRSCPTTRSLLRDLRAARSRGRTLLLATAADASSIAQRVADHLGVFDGVIASDGVRNLKGEAKARAVAALRRPRLRLRRRGPLRRPVWRTRAKAHRRAAPSATPPPHRSCAACALYQWAKNLLRVRAPGHRAPHGRRPRSPRAPAFVALRPRRLAVYLANDLADLQDDRRHPSKRARALASGELGIGVAAVMLPLLVAIAALVAAQLPSSFGALLALYLATNVVYSLWLKRIAILDVFVLAGLYTMRILAGAAAIDVPVSHWLLAFSLFAFLSLALAKRFVEVSRVASRDEARVGGRGYVAGDGQLLAMLGTACACLAALVFALYITSPQVVVLYRTPWILWFGVPLLLYWLSRVWFLAHRGILDEDPLLFALHDLQSYAVGLLVLLAIVAAT